MKGIALGLIINRVGLGFASGGGREFEDLKCHSLRGDPIIFMAHQVVHHLPNCLPCC